MTRKRKIPSDADGFVRITGRLKELIVTAGGENVSPVPIENKIIELCPLISNCVVVGDQRKFLSALIALKTDALLTTDDCGVRLISELLRSGIRIPDELQIIGRYNLPFGTYFHPGITTLDCCTDEVAHRLGRKILSLIASEPVMECEVVVPKVIRRDSSKFL